MLGLLSPVRAEGAGYTSDKSLQSLRHRVLTGNRLPCGKAFPEQVDLARKERKNLLF